jgi:DNA-binding response OmpR family regulator
MVQQPAASDEDTSRNCILIVEDDPDIGQLLILALASQTPYRPVLASNEEEALHTVEAVTPALVLLDYQLPGTTGVKVYDHLRARNELSTVPAIVLSASLPRQELQERHLVGIAKPFDLDDLLETIDQVITSSSTPQE